MTQKIPKTLIRAYGLTIEDFLAKVETWSRMRRAQLAADAMYPPCEPTPEDYPGAAALRAARDRYDHAMKHRAEVFLEAPPSIPPVVVIAVTSHGIADFEIVEAESWLM